MPPEYLNKVYLSSLTRSLIRIPSYFEYGEEEIAQFIKSELKSSGLSVKFDKVREKRNNIITKISGCGGGKKIILSGHIDTVPPYNMKNPFKGLSTKNSIYGRGAADMKGGLAAMIAVLKTVAESNESLGGDLIFAAFSTEEQLHWGAKHFVSKKIKADYAINGESSNMDIVTAIKGNTKISIKTIGKPVHSSVPAAGKNAIEEMNKVLDCLKRAKAVFCGKTHPLLGKNTLSVNTIKGGNNFNIVPEECEVVIDFRYAPSLNPSKIVKRMHKCLKRFNPEIAVLYDRKPMEIPKASKVVLSLQEAANKVLRKSLKPVGAAYWADASILYNEGKIPTVVFGPGKIENAHSNNERVSISDVVASAKIYHQTVKKVCG